MKLPFALPELDLSAPLDRHRATVKREWIDGNGHMNVGYRYDVSLPKLARALGALPLPT